MRECTELSPTETLPAHILSMIGRLSDPELIIWLQIGGYVPPRMGPRVAAVMAAHQRCEVQGRRRFVACRVIPVLARTA